MRYPIPVSNFLAPVLFLEPLDTLFLVRFFNVVKMLARNTIDAAVLRNVLGVLGKFQYCRIDLTIFSQVVIFTSYIGLFGDNPEGIRPPIFYQCVHSSPSSEI